MSQQQDKPEVTPTAGPAGGTTPHGQDRTNDPRAQEHQKLGEGGSPGTGQEPWSQSPADEEQAGQRRDDLPAQNIDAGGPRPSPGTDPTNPYRQESAGVNTASERANQRRVDEPGLTDQDRDRREPTY